MAKNNGSNNMGGRKPSFSSEIADEICERMAAGETVANICKDDHLPHYASLPKFRRQHPWFDSQYQRAREEQMYAWADEIVTIADDRSEDILTDADGNPVLNGKGEPRFNRGHPDRDRLRIETRWKLMKSFLPTVFGDRQIVDMNHHYEDKDDRELVLALRVEFEKSGLTKEEFHDFLFGDAVLQ